MEDKPPFIETVYQYWLIITIIAGVAVSMAIRLFDVSGDWAFYTLPITAPSIVIAVTLSNMRVKRGKSKANLGEFVIPGIISLHAFYLFFIY
jgi:hypothetical protein